MSNMRGTRHSVLRLSPRCSKHDNISDLVRKAVPLNVLQKELGECIVVCANCHRKIHFYGEPKLNK